MIKTEEAELPEGSTADIQDSYKYLGILQENENYEEATWMSATTKYLHRVRQVLKSWLNGKNKVQANNTYALPVIRYPAGIISSPKEETEATDFKTGKLLTIHGRFHLKSSTLRLYTKRSEGGQVW